LGHGTLERAGAVNPLEADLALFEGDLVRTGPEAFAELLLTTATRINLGPQSEIGIDRFVADLGGDISIGGAMVFDRPDDLVPIDLTVRTAFAQIGVRGTRFFVGPSNGAYAVFTERGQVTVTVGDTTRTLGPGDGVNISPEGRPPGEVVKWGAARIVAAFASVGLEAAATP
jgi:hypothetical protein